MPTIFWLGNIRIVINTKDHGPPHVHVLAPGASAKIRIDNLEVMESQGFNERTLKKILIFMEQTKFILMEKWDEIQKDQN